jgi:hypothetical protein
MKVTKEETRGALYRVIMMIDGRIKMARDNVVAAARAGNDTDAAMHAEVATQLGLLRLDIITQFVDPAAE